MNEWKLIRNPDYWTYDILLDYLMLVLLASGYVEHLGAWRKLGLLVLAAAAVLYLPLIADVLSESKAIMISGLSLLLLITVCIISSVSDANTAVNIKGLIYAFCPAATFAILSGRGLERFEVYLKKRLPLLNAVYLASLYILLRQIQGTGFMIKSSWLAQNSYYKDHCSGIFGANGTHVCGLFSILMLLLNIHYLSDIRDKFRRTLFTAYIIGTEAIMLYGAAYSDNMALFLLTPFFVLAFFYLSGQEIGILSFLKRNIRYIVLVLIICVPVGLRLLSNPEAAAVAEKLYDRIYRVIFFHDAGVGGSNERLAILADALSAPFGWSFGYGIGEEPWKGLNILGYRHFGINSIAGIVYLCGIWTFTAFMAFYVSLSTHTVECDSLLKEDSLLKTRAVSFICLLLLTVYTNVFIDIRKMILFPLIITAMQLHMRRSCIAED